MTKTKIRLVVAGVILVPLILTTGVALLIVQPWKPNPNAASSVAMNPSAANPDSNSLARAPRPSGTGPLAYPTPTTRPRPANEQMVIANRVKCAANLKSIGQAILLYANENHQAYPPDLGTLIPTEDIVPTYFVCPAVGKTVPEFNSMSPAQWVKWVNDNTDYVYAGAGLTTSAPTDRIVVYEKDSNEYGDGMNILFGDGHVDFIPSARIKEVFDKSNALPRR